MASNNYYEPEFCRLRLFSVPPISALLHGSPLYRCCKTNRSLNEDRLMLHLNLLHNSSYSVANSLKDPSLVLLQSKYTKL